MAVISWKSGVSGDWGTPADWSSGTVPGAADTVTIAASGTYTVTISAAEAAKSLTLNDAGATVSLASSTLTMGGALALTAGTFQLNAGGVISGGTLSATGGTFAWAGGELSGVTYDGTVDLSPAFSVLYVTGGLTATGAGGTGAGTINITGNGSRINAFGGETLDNATVNIGVAAGGGALNLFDPGDTAPVLTLGSHLDIVHAGGYLGIADYYSHSTDTKIINDGTITGGVSGGGIGIDGVASFTNNGTIAISNGDSLRIGPSGYNITFTNAAGGVLSVSGAGSKAQIGGNGGSWSNAGTISVSSGATLTLEDAFTTAQLTKIVDSAGTIALYGVLNNTGSTLTVGTGTADPIVVLNGGYRGFGDIVGGTIIDKGSGMVFQGGTLSGVTFDGAMNIGSSVFVNSGLTLHGVNGTGAGTINLEGDVDLYADGGETLNNATLNIGFGSYGGGAVKLFDPSHANPVLNLGSSFDIVHAGGVAELESTTTDANGAIVNAGTITAGAAGGTFVINPFGGSFTNNGTITVSNGDTLAIQSGAFTEGAGGVISVASGSTLNLGVALTTAQLSKFTNNGTIGIASTLTNTGAILTVGTGTAEPTVALDSGGVILGGTIVDEGSGILCQGGTLSGVTFEGALNVGYQGGVFVTGGLTDTGVGGTGPGVINVSGFEGQFRANGGQTLDNATVNIGAIDSLGIYNINDANPVLTFGSQFSIVQTSNGGSITDYSGFGDDTIVNDGTITAASGVGGGFFINPVNFTNNGFLIVGAGEVLDLQPGTLTNLAGTTLTGGSYEADGGSTIELNQNVTITTDKAVIILNGAGSTIQGFNTGSSAEVAIDATLTKIAAGGTLEFLGGRNWTSTAAFANAGTLDLAGGTFTAPSLANSGTVIGFGAIAAKVSNTGTIDAQGGTLSLTGALTNLSGTTLTGGTYVAGAASVLQLANNVSIATLDATVDLAGVGATVQSLNTVTTKQVALESSLTAIGATGVLEALAARDYKTSNAIANSGRIQLGGGTFASGTLTDAAGSTLTGFGTVASVFDDAGAVSATSGLTFTATGDVFAGTVSGAGNLILSGGSDAFNAGADLTVAHWTLSNAAAISVNANLTDSGALSQAAGTTLLVASGDTLSLTGTGSAIAGAISGAGTLSLAGGSQAINTGAAITTAAWTTSGKAATTLNETLSYAGTLTVAGGTSLTIAAGDTLTLTGTATLAGTINGAGALALASTGVINVTGTPATMAAGAFTNAGTVSLTASGSLSLSGSIKNAGSFSVGAGSTLTLSTATLVASGSSAVLDTALGGAIKISNASTAQITGAEVNAGTIALVSTGSATDLRVTAAGATLTGGGTITLGGSLSRVLGVSTTATLTNVDNTISGAGFVGAKQMTLINQAKGVIDAVGKGSLVVATGGAILNNAGLLEATGGGLLVLTGTTIDQSAGGTILAATGSHVDLSNVDIIGGTVESTGSGVLNVNVSGGVLDGTTSAITLAGLLQLVNGRSLTLEGSIGETGQIHMFGSTLATQLTVAAAGATLSGGGKVNLSNSVNNRIVGVSGAATLTNVNDIIAGSGVLGGGTMTLVNDAGGTILGNASAGLTIDTGANTIVNAGAIDAVNTGVHVTVKSAVDNSGKLFAAGGVLILDGAITGTGSASISGGKLDVVTASFTQNVTFTGATGVLELANSVGYTGTVKGLSLTGTSSLDLVDIGFTSGVTKASYVDNGSKTGGVLTVTDGTHTAHITLAGNYSASVFTTSGDGHGGTTVVDPRTSAFVQAIAGTGAPSSAPSPTAAHDLDRMSQPALVAPRRFSS